MKMQFSKEVESNQKDEEERLLFDIAEAANLTEAENVLYKLANVFFSAPSAIQQKPGLNEELPDVEARYRTLVEQIPAVVFMAFLEKGIGEAYVSPQIEAMLGFSQEE